jgi:hypothetical protein
MARPRPRESATACRAPWACAKDPLHQARAQCAPALSRRVNFMRIACGRPSVAAGVGNRNGYLENFFK